MKETSFAVIGGGLAGCECALALARAGFGVSLYEQRPENRSPAHKTEGLAELVCSNSLRSVSRESAIGLLKNEARALGSACMRAADATAVPAGTALAVDRRAFSEAIEREIMSHEHVRLIRREVRDLNDEEIKRNGKEGIIIAAGPLVSDSLARSLAEITGEENCYFYDAIAPVIWTDSVDKNIVFRATRRGAVGEEGDYLNCPMNAEEYEAFYKALLSAETFPTRDFEKETHFEGCMPIEALAARGPRTLAFGPLKPVGLTDPRAGRRPAAVLQLRAENADFSACNLVGCQTKMLYPEQERVFRLVPGLAKAEFARFGRMHRNTYINAPKILTRGGELLGQPGIYVAGQLSGVEGYVESAAHGLWLGTYLAAKAGGRELVPPPEETALGALLSSLGRAVKNFQPSNVTFGLMPPLEGKIKKANRKSLYAARAEAGFSRWLSENQEILERKGE